MPSKIHKVFRWCGFLMALVWAVSVVLLPPSATLYFVLNF